MMQRDICLIDQKFTFIHQTEIYLAPRQCQMFSMPFDTSLLHGSYRAKRNVSALFLMTTLHHSLQDRLCFSRNPADFPIMQIHVLCIPECFQNAIIAVMFPNTSYPHKQTPTSQTAICISKRMILYIPKNVHPHKKALPDWS
jgi:hypothetical protein